MIQRYSNVAAMVVLGVAVAAAPSQSSQPSLRTPAQGVPWLPRPRAESAPAALQQPPSDAVDAARPLAKTSLGTVEGRAREGGGAEFLGIPYAAPPIGALRFAPPRPFDKHWGPGPFDAGSFGSQCPQPGTVVGLPVGAENCLFVNVYRPHFQRERAALPVMVFIHGGSFIAGAGSLYDGMSLATQGDVIVVTLNYRLGVLGFAVFDEHLQARSTTGNWGLLDQRAALRWVQTEIAGFGGDPGRVSIFGESAGAISVMTHVLTRISDGLFHAAISESGFPYTYSSAFGLDVTEAVASSRAASCPTGAGKLDCLRGLPLRAVLEAEGAFDPDLALRAFENKLAWGPTVDGVLIKEDIHTTMAAEDFHISIPVMMGSNTDEGTLFVEGLYYAEPWTERHYYSWVNDTVFNSAAGAPLSLSYTLERLTTLLELYPYSALDVNKRVAADLLADLTFVCGTRRTAARLAATNTSTFVYHFDVLRLLACNPVQLIYGVVHTAELEWVFGKPAIPPIDDCVVFALNERTLVTKIQGWWSNMASQPAVGPGQDWAPYSAHLDNQQHMFLREPGPVLITQTTHRRARFCDAWDKLTPK